MTMPFTLQFATYAFPNRTFELVGHDLRSSVPTGTLQRKDGGVVLNGFLTPKQFLINGKFFSNDIDSLHEQLNIFTKSLHNKGQAAFLLYRSDRQVKCRMGANGIKLMYEKGLYQYVANLQLEMTAANPFAESPTVKTSSGTRNNASSAASLTNAGHYPAGPIFTFVASTRNFSNNLYVINTANSLAFNFIGPLIAGQTLVVDCDAGCVLLQIGATMVDSMSLFSGDLFLQLEEGANSLVLSGGCYAYTINWYDRWYF